MIAIRPVLPLMNYAINYEYIVKNLCENRNKPQSTCKGKCYIQKELAKTEKQSNTPQTIKISELDVFLSGEILLFTNEILDFQLKNLNTHYFNLHTVEYYSQIFHPPLA